MNTDKLIFGIIALITVVITFFIIFTSLTKEPPLEVDASVIGNDPHIKGPADAQLTIVEFSDFECPACGFYAPQLAAISATYPNEVAVVYRHFPLTNIHPRAIPAARASEAAALQGKFWQYHDELFANQENLTDEDLVRYAEVIGLDIEQFNADRASSDVADKVTEDAETAGRLALNSTPSFFFVSSDGTAKKITITQTQSLQDLVRNEVGEPSGETGEAPLPGNGEGQDEMVDDANSVNAISAISYLVNEQRDDINPSEVEVVSITPATWGDSSLGCPQPGMNYAQVVTEGSEVVLDANGETFNIHVANGGDNVVLCE